MLPLEVPSWYSSLLTGLYDPKTFITHAALLRQTFVHCARFPTAAFRRSLDRVSVPVWLIILSDQLSIFGLVSHYLTNYLMDREPIQERHKCLSHLSPQREITYAVLAVLSNSYPLLLGTLFTCSSPVRHSTCSPKRAFAFDLHVLSTPPTFVLSQDQTLHKLWFDSLVVHRVDYHSL